MLYVENVMTNHSTVNAINHLNTNVAEPVNEETLRSSVSAAPYVLLGVCLGKFTPAGRTSQAEWTIAVGIHLVHSSGGHDTQYQRVCN